MFYQRSAAVLAVMLFAAQAVHAAVPDDTYIAGYAAGVLKHTLLLDIPSLTVQDGVIILPAGSLGDVDREKVVRVLSEIPGVNMVRIAEAAHQPPMVNASSQPVRQFSEKPVGAAANAALLPTGLLPAGHLFKPLLADPRWAHFSAAYRNFQNDNFDGRNIASVSFGETIPIYRRNLGESVAQWEVGLQGGVFSDFNLGAPSSDLVNSDFIASVYSSFRAKQFSAFGRIYHQSSHLGDEFLLRKEGSAFERVNLSYEGVDLRLSYEFPYGVRLYGGGGGLFHKEPSALKVWMVQYGAEFRSPWRIGSAPVRPILAADFKNFQENNWGTDISARAGIEFENLQVLGRKLQLLVEYFDGHSSSGQFFKNKVEYIGVGAHYHF
ncbi:DUF1207 domain-containing protein [Nitrosomonas oligotropha]|uniref:DUF1207 domain-containing protein n=1 Tax=Nitrosomonas oligotropha TaxID=42354 RepID=UPI00136A08F9|nr:DUF1207 domain-containing protein [Nitrosomonas oligotropha]MXS82125.1 DUF1207 domain-containing protein [Nitrosomonas oligotropha]